MIKVKHFGNLELLNNFFFQTRHIIISIETIEGDLNSNGYVIEGTRSLRVFYKEY